MHPLTHTQIAKHKRVCTQSHLAKSLILLPTHQLSYSHTRTFIHTHTHSNMNTTQIRLSLTQSPHRCRLAHTYKEVLTNTCLEALVHTPKPLCTHTLSQHTSTRTQALKHTHTQKLSHALTHTPIQKDAVIQDLFKKATSEQPPNFFIAFLFFLLRLKNFKNPFPGKISAVFFRDAIFGRKFSDLTRTLLK